MVYDAFSKSMLIKNIFDFFQLVPGSVFRSGFVWSYAWGILQAQPVGQPNFK